MNVDSMDITEAKIGMFVRGNDRHRYHYINSDMTLGVIIDVHKNNNTMDVMILRHEEYEDKRYYKYLVHPKFFDIVDNSQVELTEKEQHVINLLFNKAADLDGEYNMHGYEIASKYGASTMFLYANRFYAVRGCDDGRS